MINSEWTSLKLGEVLTLKRGYDLPQAKRINGNVPIFSSAGLSGYHNEAKVEGPGVITGRYGTLGEVFYCENKYWPHNTTLYVQNFRGNDPKFIYYFLKTLGFANNNDKTSVPGVNRNDLHEMKVAIPPLVKQRHIASILTSLDDKIELNQQTNHTLEAITQALFKEWFIDFNFPGAIGEMQASELGEIPKGWRIGIINDLFTISKEGINPSLSPDKQFNHYSLPAFDEGRKPSSEIGSQILSNKFKVKDNSILVSKLNPRIPRIWPVTEALENSICSTEFQVIIPKNVYYFSFGASLFLQNNIIEIMKGRATGTSSSHQRIRPQDILDIQITVPNDEILLAFEKTVRNFYDTILLNEQQNETLTQLRVGLLPKLMIGNLTLKK